MVKSLNKVMIIGSVGRVPEMRYMPSGEPVTSFSVGTTRTWTNRKDELHTETEWFNVVAWSDLAEICRQILREDHYVYVEGRLQTRSWEGSDGEKYFRTELVAQDVIPLEDVPQEAHTAEHA